MMRKTFAAGIALGITLAGVPTPAHAAVVLHGCDERGDAWGSLCLFDGTEYGKGSWVRYDLREIAQRAGGCLTLPPSFRSVASSFAHNPSWVGSAALGPDARLRFWNGTYCTGRATSWPADTERSDNDLRTTVNYGNISNWTDSISIR